MKQKPEQFTCLVHVPDHCPSEICPLSWACWQMTELPALQRGSNLAALSPAHWDRCQPELHENLSRRTKQNEPQCLRGPLSLWKLAFEGSRNSLFLCFPDHPRNRSSVFLTPLSTMLYRLTTDSELMRQTTTDWYPDRDGRLKTSCQVFCYRTKLMQLSCKKSPNERGMCYRY